MAKMFLIPKNDMDAKREIVEISKYKILASSKLFCSTGEMNMTKKIIRA